MHIINMYVCMYMCVCMYVCTDVHVCTYVCMQIVMVFAYSRTYYNTIPVGSK